MGDLGLNSVSVHLQTINAKILLKVSLIENLGCFDKPKTRGAGSD